MRKRKDPNAWFQAAKTVTEDPEASDWLKHSLIEAINRDPTDAAKDAEVLYGILKLRVDAAYRMQPAQSGKRKPPLTTAS